MITFQTKSFNELNNVELYQLLQLRNEVFIVEQTCPYPDLDEKDYKCLHVLGIENNKVVAYCRLVPKGISYKNEASIGRVVTACSVRRFGYGKLLMHYAISETLRQFETNEIVISAQQYLEKFYSGFGFVSEGESYLEDDIPHIKMRYLK
jgi:ElaA protein